MLATSHWQRAAKWAAALLALGIATLWTDTHLPAATVLSQCLTVSGWGMFVLAIRPSGSIREVAAVQGALALILASTVGSTVFGSLPRSVAWSQGGALFAAMVLVWTGCMAARASDADDALQAFMSGLLICGVGNAAVSVIQVFAPDWTDGVVLAVSYVPGRAVGQLHQPNLLASLLVWSLVALAVLTDRQPSLRLVAVPLTVLVVLGIELTGSRTGAIELLVVGLWGWCERRLGRVGRRCLMVAPLVLIAWFGVLEAWQHLGGASAVGAAGRLQAEASATASPNGRLNLWGDALQLIALQPWAGVGFGEFNTAWTLTPFIDRPSAHFDHAHNLILQLFVELGLPVGLLVTGLLVIGARQAWRRSGEAGVGARGMVMLVATIGVHSIIEYPLWYTWFLLPTAFAAGYGLAASKQAAAADNAARTWLLGLLLAVGGLAAAADYLRVTHIYDSAPDFAAARQQLVRGQRSFFFAHYADYVAATAVPAMPTQGVGMEHAIHGFLDARLMIVWARRLAAQGRVDEARYVSQRLREFRRPEAQEFFTPCVRQLTANVPFQCQPPAERHDWRSLTRMP